MSNPRTRGKIAHTEWPKIAQRFAKGESLTEIARSYQCTAPAIRYIVRRTPNDGTPVKGGTVSAYREPVKETGAARTQQQGGLGTKVDRTVWSRVNSDIAAFLTAVDTLIDENSAENEETLLQATDRLLRASARARLELERSINRRNNRDDDK